MPQLAEEPHDLTDAAVVREDAGVHAGDRGRAGRADQRPREAVPAVVDVDLAGPLEPVPGVVLVQHVADRGEAVVSDALDGRIGERARRRPRLLDEGAALVGVRLVEGGEVTVDRGAGVAHGSSSVVVADVHERRRAAVSGR